MFHCRGNLWVRMLDSKYEGLKGLDEGGVKSCESIWWRDLKLVCGREHDRWFDGIVEWKIGDGKNTSLLEDAWCGDESLKYVFARMFLNSEQNMKLWET